MRQIAFDQRHPALTRQAILLLSVLTYVFWPEDAIWHLVQHSPHARLLEHLCFGIAALLLGAGAWLRTSANARAATTPGSLAPQHWLGDLLCALAIGSLLPLPGCLFLILGESIRLYRQVHVAKRNPRAPFITLGKTTAWRYALRDQLGFWIAFVAMIVFSITLIDRLAEALFALAALAGLLVYRISGRLPRSAHSPML